MQRQPPTTIRLVAEAIGILGVSFAVAYLALRVLGAELKDAMFLWAIVILGTLTAMPLAFLRRKRILQGFGPEQVETPSQLRAAGLLPGIAVMLIGLATTGLLTAWMVHDRDQEGLAYFELMSDRIEDDIAQRLLRYRNGMQSIGAFLAVSPNIDPDDVATYFDQLDLPTLYPGAIGAGLIQPSPSDDAPARFVVSYRAASGRLPSDDEIDIEKFPTFQAAVRLAMQSGQFTVSAPVDLSSLGVDRKGVFCLIPVGYRDSEDHGAATSVDRSVSGVAFMPLDLQTALSDLLSESNAVVDVEIFDDYGISTDSLLFDADDHILHHRHSIGEKDYAGRALRRESSLTVGGRRWGLWLSSRSKFATMIDHVRVYTTTILGILFTGVLSAFVWMLGSSRGRALILAKSMTAELRAAKDSAESALADLTAFRSAIDKHSIMSITDHQGRLIDVNAGFCEISGYRKDEVLGKDHRILNSGHHPPEFWKALWDTILAGDAWRGEICNRNKAGELYWVDSTIVPFKSDDGLGDRFVTFRFDVTAKKMADQEKAHLVAIVDSTQDAVISTSIVGFVNSWNPGAESLFQYKADEAIGQRIDFFVPVGFEDQVALAHQRVVQFGEFERFESRRKRKDGTLVDIAITMSPIRDESGEIIGASTIAHDITEQKQFERDLVDSRNKAESASRSKSEFLANMSHEIRTPMTAILGYADLLLDPTADAGTQYQLVSTIRRNGEYLLAIINDILDLSKIEANQLAIERVSCQPDRIVRDVLVQLLFKAEEKSLELKADYKTDIPFMVTTDPLRLRQILANLVGNAIKFTKQGRVTVSVSYSQEKGGRLKFEIEDSGIGMSPEQIEHIFDDFEQADTTSTREFGGIGLGLGIAKKLLRLLDGKIDVMSAPGVGSVFTFTISAPAIPQVEMVQAGEVDIRAEASTPNARVIAVSDNAANPSPKAGKPLDGLRILLVEDGPDNQRLIKFHLTKAGANVTVHENGLRALLALTADSTIEGSLLDPIPFDLIISDMQMPEMDGYELVRRLRAKGAALPIIALTAHAMQGDNQKCMEAGCDEYTTKPIDRGELIRVCRTWSEHVAAAGA